MVDVLANWAWQGCAVALAATGILRASRRMSATTRYHLWWVTLSVVLALPALSFQLPASSSQPPAPSFRQEALNAQSGDSAPKALAGSWQLGAESLLPAAGSVVLPTLPAWSLSLLLLVWFAWATVSLSRTLGALVTLRHAKRAARPFPVARESRLETWLSLRARGRRTVLGVSDTVRAAAVLGLRSPSIVVAPSALGALNDSELDQIVVHEWAHVQRRDDVARLVQRVIVALVGLHPAIWWIDRQLNLERETACDDWAVNATGSARGLAVCLTKLAALPGRPADAVLVPAALLSSELTTRVVRLLDGGRNTSTTRTLGVPMLIVPVLAALALVVASVELVVTSPIAPDTPHAAVAAGSAVAALAMSLDSAAAAASPRAVPITGDAPTRPPARARRPAVAQSRTRGQATAAHESSELTVAPERADAGVTSTAQQSPQRQEVVTAPARPVVEGELGADLPGIRMPAAAGLTPGAPVGSGVPAGARPVASPTPWGAAADAGVTVGKGSQKAAVATAGFFTRLSKSITGVF
jgi:beta-lactamase regulating signal transducer with metallopeptidase domain